MSVRGETRVPVLGPDYITISFNLTKVDIRNYYMVLDRRAAWQTSGAISSASFLQRNTKDSLASCILLAADSRYRCFSKSEVCTSLWIIPNTHASKDGEDCRNLVLY